MFLPTALLVLTGPVAAQELAPQAPSLDEIVRSSFGVVRADDRLEAIGPDFKASFDAASFTFTPALGERTERNLPVTLSGARADRGGPAFRADPLALPTGIGTTVLYDHGSFVERYDVDADGIEQSFVFDTLPQGSGDLVVALDLTTDLPLELLDGGRAGAQLSMPGAGGVHLSPVIGIDADGDQVPGTIRLDGDSIEWILPAAFVDSADLPLVVDPTLSTHFDVAGGSNDGRQPRSRLRPGERHLARRVDALLLGERQGHPGAAASPPRVSSWATCCRSRPAAPCRTSARRSPACRCATPGS